MKLFFALSIFILFLVWVQFASAQTVDEVIDKYMQARGGKEKLKAIKTIYMEGSREMMGNEVAVKVTKVQGQLSRTEFEMGSTNGYNLITDKEAWNYFPMRSPEPQKLADSMLSALQTELDIAGPLVDYVAKGHRVELEGKETVGDIVCYKIRLTTSTGKNIIYWIQADNYLMLQSTPTTPLLVRRMNNAAGGAPSGGNEQKASKVFIMYKDYKAVDGVLFPHTLDLRTEGADMPGGGTTFDKIELNGTVSEQLYKP